MLGHLPVLALLCAFVTAAPEDNKPIRKRIVFTDQAAPPIGSYSQAVIAGQTMYLAGQIGIDANGDLVSGGIGPETIQAFANIKAILASVGATPKNIVKVQVFLADIGDWPVANAIYTGFFDDNGLEGKYPARTSMQAAALPLGVRIEIDVIAVIGKLIAP